jgi:hypothetical protein
MHLHGMWSDLETGDNRYIPRKHTVIVQPGAKISYRVQVDAKGSWAYHCPLGLAPSVLRSSTSPITLVTTGSSSIPLANDGDVKTNTQLMIIGISHASIR